MKLCNKKVIITGASKGLGKEIAVHFIKAGASIAICSRHGDELNDVIRELKSIACNDQLVCGISADISNIEGVKTFVQFSVERMGSVDCLVNNAGIYGPKGIIGELDLIKWIDAVEINILGVLYMCNTVVPYMKDNKKGKIINISGGGATKPMHGLSAYATTKAAVVRFTETMAMELKNDNIFINAIAPGALNTNMLEEILVEGKGKVSEEFYRASLAQKESGGTPLSKGAELCVYLASDESDGVTGKLISAVWDDYKTLHKHLDILDSDIYTLRRIVPEDRGVKL
jgi:3-oxoacyl-[acyl-carrier protein] reductase